MSISSPALTSLSLLTIFRLSVTFTFFNVTFPSFFTLIVYIITSLALTLVVSVISSSFSSPEYIKDAVSFITVIWGSASSGTIVAGSSGSGIVSSDALAVLIISFWLSTSSCVITYVPVKVFSSPAAKATVSPIFSSPSYKSIPLLLLIASFTATFNSSLPVFFNMILKYAVWPTFNVTLSPYSPSNASLTVLLNSKFEVFTVSVGFLLPTVAVFSIAPSTFSTSTVNVSFATALAFTVTSMPFVIASSVISFPSSIIFETNLVFSGTVSFTNVVVSMFPVFSTVIVYLISSPILAGPLTFFPALYISDVFSDFITAFPVSFVFLPSTVATFVIEPSTLSLTLTKNLKATSVCFGILTFHTILPFSSFPSGPTSIRVVFSGTTS